MFHICACCLCIFPYALCRFEYRQGAQPGTAWLGHDDLASHPLANLVGCCTQSLLFTDVVVILFLRDRVGFYLCLLIFSMIYGLRARSIVMICATVCREYPDIREWNYLLTAWLTARWKSNECSYSLMVNAPVHFCMVSSNAYECSYSLMVNAPVHFCMAFLQMHMGT